MAQVGIPLPVRSSQATGDGSGEDPWCSKDHTRTIPAHPRSIGNKTSVLILHGKCWERDGLKGLEKMNLTVTRMSPFLESKQKYFAEVQKNSETDRHCTSDHTELQNLRVHGFLPTCSTSNSPYSRNTA